MDDCEQILRELEPFLDRELSPEAWQSVHAHINGCLDCLHVFDFHAELRMVISKKCQQDALPPGLLARIEACFGTVEPEDMDEVGGDPGLA
jgi:anti-sigma factor (TIGR02949 family)